MQCPAIDLTLGTGIDADSEGGQDTFYANPSELGKIAPNLERKEN